MLSDDYSDVYLLRPLDADEFRAKVELHELSVRWQIASEEGSQPWQQSSAAVHQGDVDLGVHPALLEDRERRDSLEALVRRTRDTEQPGWSYGVRAAFERLPGPEPIAMSHWRVRWLPLTPR